MPVADTQVATLRAYLTQDFDEYRKLREQLRQEELRTGYAMMIGAGFVTAVERRFSVNDPVADIVQYVGEARSRFAELSEEIDPRSAERLIMTVFTDEPIDDIDEGNAASIEMLLMTALILDENLDDAGLDAFLADARALADEWTT